MPDPAFQFSGLHTIEEDTISTPSAARGPHDHTRQASDPDNVGRFVSNSGSNATQPIGTLELPGAQNIGPIFGGGWDIQNTQHNTRSFSDAGGQRNDPFLVLGFDFQ